MTNAILVLKTSNSKLGNVAATYSSIESSCPTDCSLKDNGCYAQMGFVGIHTSKLNKKKATPKQVASEEAKLIKKAVKNPEIIVQTKVNINKNAVNVYFGNLQKTSSLFYQLSYITNGKQEGAGGTITTKGKYSLSRNLIFGTCSAGVCRYHKKISNAKLNVTVTYLDGKTKTKTYGVRL